MLHIILLLNIVCSKPLLKFKNDKFRILHLTDFHFGEQEDKDDKNIDGLYKILEFAKPDFVIVTGDLVSGYSWRGGDQNFFQKAHQKFIQPFIDNNVNYMYTLGNHDDEGNMDRYEIMELDSKVEQSYTMYQPFHSTNYFVPIYNEEGSKEIFRIWGLDSNDFGCHGHSGSWGCVYEEVVNAFLNEKQETNYGLVAMHIPPPEFLELYKKYPTFGQYKEQIACPVYNTGVVQAILEKGNLQYLIVGHDHSNDFGGQFPGEKLDLLMMYGRKSGYGGYDLCCNRIMGGRIIDLSVVNGKEITSDHFIIDYLNQTTLDLAEEYKSSEEIKCVLKNGDAFILSELLGASILLYIFILITVFVTLRIRFTIKHAFSYEKQKKLQQLDLKEDDF